MSETTSEPSEGGADFNAGFEGADAPKVTTKPDPAPEKTQETAEAKPEYVTKAELAEIKKAIEDASKTSSKAFGTAGKVQQLVNELRAQSEGRQATTSAEALGKLKGQFPELGEAIEAVMAGQPKPPTFDDETFEKKFRERLHADQLTHLNDEYENWKTIVGVPPAANQPPPETPFRQWLAGKDESYQTRINETESPADIQRAIARFQRETRTAPKATPRPDARAERLREMVQPRGDGAAPPSTNDAEAAFAEGFRS